MKRFPGKWTDHVLPCEQMAAQGSPRRGSPIRGGRARTPRSRNTFIGRLGLAPPCSEIGVLRFGFGSRVRPITRPRPRGHRGWAEPGWWQPPSTGPCWSWNGASRHSWSWTSKSDCENGSLMRVARWIRVGIDGGLNSIPAAWSGCLRFTE